MYVTSVLCCCCPFSCPVSQFAPRLYLHPAHANIFIIMFFIMFFFCLVILSNLFKVPSALYICIVSIDLLFLNTDCMTLSKYLS